MVICNACRYCEGYCSVFPAMELRRGFTSGDLSYLANLCHDCRGCYYACQYAPPHEFALNLPQALARVRAETYVEYAWPKPLAGLFQRNGMIVSLVTSLSIALVLVLTMNLQSPSILYQPNSAPGSFYAVIPEAVMLSVAIATFGFAVLALAMGCRNFWRDTGGGSVAQARPLLQARFGCLDAAQSRRFGSWLQQPRRSVLASAALRSPGAVLWISAVRGFDDCGGVLRTRSGFARALSIPQHPGHTWHSGWSWEC